MKAKNAKYQPSINRMHRQAQEIDDAIAAGTIAEHPQFSDAPIHPESLLHIARGQSAALREGAKRMAVLRK